MVQKGFGGINIPNSIIKLQMQHICWCKTGGLGGTNIFQFNNQSHKCNMYVVQKGFGCTNILPNIIESHIAL